ncbi:hypothetical protein KO508_15820 [Marinobacter salexigens]|uniref:HEAT repeat domain-containing protein n=1 Tax=Marinobacter salexigens TaxID=1925763 RepID=A0ABS6AE65_9GAMM|nr:hypothetical protein [Marinobacter salexigens]
MADVLVRRNDLNRALGLLYLMATLVLSGCNSENSSGNTEAVTDALAEDIGLISGKPFRDISLALKPAQLDWVGQKIFQNECAGKYECLVHWNESEAFPSLGIGHFIWYPSGVNGRFTESFPALYQYMEQRQRNIPEWLRELDPFHAPWPDRETFLQVADSPQVAELREFLAGSQGIQAEFIFRRAKESLVKVVEAAPQARQGDVQAKLRALIQTPGGVYALMDYVNFKGEGLSPNERYNDEGWGLLQVLLAMPEATAASNVLPQFRKAAAQVLTRRAANADNPVERERWLAGWLKRLDTYKEPVDMGSVTGMSS